MKQFIRLHSFEDNTIVLFNVDNIEGVSTTADEEGKIYSYVYVEHVDDGVAVNETPEKIYKMLSEFKNIQMLKLHEAEANTVLVLNIETIVAILTVTDNGKTYAKLFTHMFEEGVIVNETPDKIYSLLNEIKK